MEWEWALLGRYYLNITLHPKCPEFNFSNSIISTLMWSFSSLCHYIIERLRNFYETGWALCSKDYRKVQAHQGYVKAALKMLLCEGLCFIESFDDEASFICCCLAILPWHWESASVLMTRNIPTFFGDSWGFITILHSGDSLPFSTRPPGAPLDFSCFAHQPTATANYTPVPTFLLIWAAVTWPAPPTVPPVSTLPDQPCRYFTALLPLEPCQFIVVGYLCFSSLLLFVFGSCLLLCLRAVSTINYWCQPSDYLVSCICTWLLMPCTTHLDTWNWNVICCIYNKNRLGLSQTKNE